MVPNLICPVLATIGRRPLYMKNSIIRGLGNELIAPSELDPGGNGPVSCRKRLGGLLRYYHREAA